MVAIFEAVLLIVMIAACVGLRNCEKQNENNGSEEPIESETPLVPIKISHPHQGQLSNDTSDAYDSRQNSIDSNDAMEMNQVVQEAEPVSAEEAQIVSVKSPRERRRISTRILSPAPRTQLENITNSSSEVSGGNIMVQAPIETNPRAFVSSSHEASAMSESRSFPPDYSTSPGLVLNQKYLSDGKRNVTATLISSRSDESIRFKEYEDDEPQRFDLSAPVGNQCSPVDHSTMRRKSRVVDVFETTRGTTWSAHSHSFIKCSQESAFMWLYKYRLKHRDRTRRFFLTFGTGEEKEILEGNTLYVQDTNSNDYINVFNPRYIEIGAVIYENNNLYLTFSIDGSRVRADPRVVLGEIQTLILTII